MEAVTFIGLGVAAVVLGLAVIENDHPQLDPQLNQGGGGGATNNNPPALTCQQAIDSLPPAIKELTAGVLAQSTDPTAMKAYATTLESGAGQPGMTDLQRRAVLTAAQCIRERANLLALKPVQQANATQLQTPSYVYESPGQAMPQQSTLTPMQVAMRQAQATYPQYLQQLGML